MLWCGKALQYSYIIGFKSDLLNAVIMIIFSYAISWRYNVNIITKYLFFYVKNAIITKVAYLYSNNKHSADRYLKKS